MIHITLVQVGIGTVGGAVVDQVIANRARWSRDYKLDVAIGAVIGRGGALVDASLNGLSDDLLRAAVDGRRAGNGLLDIAAEQGRSLIDPAEAIAELAAEHRTIVLDAAAGEETAALDARAVSMGAGVVLSNKAPLALPLRNPIAALLWESAGPGGHLRYEATCGAGLPVISTLRAMLDTGDEPLEIQGALSGTLGAIFAGLANGESFSTAVADAKARGYTEPDPRDDLSGLDVARKALILARTIGRRIDLPDIAVEGLVPESLQSVDVETFLARSSELDAAMAERVAAAVADGNALKYVATVAAGGPVAVGPRPVSTGGVLGALRGPDNVIAIRSRRYDDYPLTIVGPGAGADVTAAGMIGDALALALGPLVGSIRGGTV